MATPSHGVERILALLEGEAADATLEAAAELAAARGLPLVGLLVEDADLLSTSGLPFASEIGLVSGKRRSISPEEVAARTQARSDRFRRLLLDMAQRHGIHADLEVGRGRQTQAVLGRLRPEDMLVVRRISWVRRPGGLLENLLGGAHCAVLLVGNHASLRARTGPPMVLLDGSDGSTRALLTAIALAIRERRGLTLLVAPGQQAASVHQQARTLLADHGVEGQFIDLRRLDAGEVLRIVRQEHPQLLFVNRGSPLLEGPQGHRLAERQDLPLVLTP